MAASPRLQTDEEEVLAANRTFYTALHTLDMSLMAQVWLHADWVKCLHPGWDLLVGWDEVRGSWEEIFRSTEQMMVSISRPLVHVAGDVAWISCLENVTTAYPKRLFLGAGGGHQHLLAPPGPLADGASSHHAFGRTPAGCNRTRAVAAGLPRHLAR